MESHVSLPSAFSLLLSAYSEIITVGVNFNITVGVFESKGESIYRENAEYRRQRRLREATEQS